MGILDLPSIEDRLRGKRAVLWWVVCLIYECIVWGKGMQSLWYMHVFPIAYGIALFVIQVYQEWRAPIEAECKAQEERDRAFNAIIRLNEQLRGQDSDK